ncbi:THC0290_0291 family protein [Flavobacterium sp. N2038]|uniref:THC0290_0291 family protein n=1 Tax=Flavobacterium sp. N2038 TaxID=2986829 RepID=UPI00222434B1|nr:glutamate dehydrogenase [Flavobacterium sp. N2038]
MLKPIIITLFAILGISTTATAQSDIAQEIGIFAGPVTLQSDFGERNNFDTNVGNTGFGIGIIHFINFSAANNHETFFSEHFKVRSELSFSKTDLQHFGRWVEKKPANLTINQLKGMSASSTVFGLGSQLEFSFIKIHDFENNVGSFSPYLSAGIMINYYSSKIGSSLGDITLPHITPGKYLTPSDGRPHGFSSETGIAASITGGLGVHYKLTTMSDLMFETRFQMFTSDWIDGLNPNKDIYKENKSNDWQVWFNFGYIYYLEF